MKATMAWRCRGSQCYFRVGVIEWYQSLGYRELDPLNPLPPAYESEPDDEIEVENSIEHEDKTIPASVHEDSVDTAIPAERARQANVRNDASGSRPVRGAVELRRWFEKSESVFEISECAEGKMVKFAAATLEGSALTWWKNKVATIGLENVNQMPWTEMKQLMTVEFKEWSMNCKT
nr:putative reverse transcriptase domain-containing protein [Tanacetum cinerariifolium]